MMKMNQSHPGSQQQTGNDNKAQGTALLDDISQAPSSMRGRFTPQHTSFLQRTIGNRAVGQLLFSSTNQSGSTVIQRLVKDDRGGDAKIKIRGTASYANYKGAVKDYADFLLDDANYKFTAKGYQPFNKELNTRMANLDPEYLQFLSESDLNDILKTKKTSISEKQLSDVYDALRSKRNLLVETPRHLGLRSIRDPSKDQPTTAVKAPQSNSFQTPFSGPYGKEWKKDTNDKSALAIEQDQWATGVKDFTRTDATSGNTYHTCPVCSSQFKPSQMTTDHQVPFETLKSKAFDLAHYASLSPKHEKAVRKRLPKFDTYFKKDSKNQYLPTNEMVNDYSNDFKNTLRICNGCNSIVGGKGTVDPIDFFKDLPMFGDQFIRFALNGGSKTEEFFGNPSPDSGWGEKAREWITSIISHFTDIISTVAAMKEKRVKELTLLQSDVYEAKNSSDPLINGELDNRKAKFNKRRLSAAFGSSIETTISARDKFTDYEDGQSDEEDLITKTTKAVTQTLDQREERKKRKTDTYKKKVEEQLKGNDDGKSSMSSRLARDDANERKTIIGNMAKCEVLGISYIGKPLIGTTTMDNGIMDEAKKNALEEVKKLTEESYTLGLSKKTALMPPFNWFFQPEAFQKLYSIIQDANQQGLDKHSEVPMTLDK